MTPTPDEFDHTIRSDDRSADHPPDEGATIPQPDASSPALESPRTRKPSPDEGATISEGAASRSAGVTPGSTIEQRFADLTEIGRGGMGIVYRARDRHLGRSVALKQMRRDSAENQRAIARFWQEARTIATLDHFNIVRIYNIVPDGESLWIEMELVEGGTLQDLITRDGALPVERVIDIGGQLCEALSLAHEKGIIHRDIKPANILLTARGTPKLADFGLARDLGAVATFTMTGAMMGTMYYAAPEQLVSGKHVDQRSDLYSLGATLYAASTGQSPRMIRLDAVPEELRDVLAKCLEEVPDRRYATTTELAEALTESRSGRGSSGKTSEVGCLKCGHENPVDIRFCQKCGGDLSSLFRKCPGCERENRIDVEYCGGCGVNIAAHAEATTALEQAKTALDDRQYETAIEHAERGLTTGARKEDLQQVRDEAQAACKQIESLINEAKQGISNGAFDDIATTLKTLASLIPRDGRDWDVLEQLQREYATQARNIRLENMIKHARIEMSNKAYDNTIAICNRALQDFPEHPDLIHMRREASYRKQKLKSVKYVVKAVRIILAALAVTAMTIIWLPCLGVLRLGLILNAENPVKGVTGVVLIIIMVGVLLTCIGSSLFSVVTR